MYTLEELEQMATAGLIDWQVYYNALQSLQDMQENRSHHIQAAIDNYQAEQDFDSYAATTDQMYGTNLQDKAARLRQQCNPGSHE